MLLEVSALEERRKAVEATEPSEWRTFKLTPDQKSRFRIKGINSKGYRIAQERITEHTRLTCGNITHVDDLEETSLFKHMTAIAYHLVTDWEGIYDKKSGMEVPFTHDNLATVLKYSGDLGVVLHGWILEQATDIQIVTNRELETKVGKPWSFSDSMQKDSEASKPEESEQDLENQSSLNPK